MATVLDDSDVRLFPPLVFLAGLVAGYALWWFWPVGLAPGQWSIPIRLVGALALVVGMALIYDAAAWFSRAGTTTDPRGPTTVIVEGGPYQFTRNPIYLGMALVVGGLALIGNALWPLLTLIPMIVVIHTTVIAKEERYLEAKFGDQYGAYKTRVRRWL